MAMQAHLAIRDLAGLIRHLAGGNIKAREDFFGRRPERVALAARLIRSDHVDAVLCDAEEAVQETWAVLSQAARDARLGWIQSLDQLEKLHRRVLRRRILMAARHFATRRQGGRCHRTVLEDLDQLFSRVPPAEAMILEADQVERLLGLLNDPTLRDLARRRMDGASNEDLARDLGVSVRTIERRLELIRKIIRRSWPEARNRDDRAMDESA